VSSLATIGETGLFHDYLSSCCRSSDETIAEPGYAVGDYQEKEFSPSRARRGNWIGTFFDENHLACFHRKIHGKSYQKHQKHYFDPKKWKD
jgi:hypothetical protein